MFEKLNYDEYLEDNPFYKGLGIDLKKYGKIDKKIEQDIYSAVDKDNKIPFPSELDDLTRLHFLITSRKVTTILEFGVGKSSFVFDDALRINKKKHSDYVKNNLRRANPFECISIDNNQEFIKITENEFGDLSRVKFHYSELEISTFNSRVCTFYTDVPNVCPDFIYLDGPDLWSAKGDIRGISTRHIDRMPMAADILAFEHFLTPGTLIVVDGRTANARFLKSNLQRNWIHNHSIVYDQHFFELREEPLGNLNKRQIEFCLGKSWLNSLEINQ